MGLSGARQITQGTVEVNLKEDFRALGWALGGIREGIRRHPFIEFLKYLKIPTI